jgi:preprotein translocase subunit SecY
MDGMFQALINAFRIPELRNKLLFTLGMLVVYRLGFWIPLPGVNQEMLATNVQLMGGEDNALKRITLFVNTFSGGSFDQSTIFGLGIMPYISASIIFQLFSAVIPSLKKIQEEGPTGRQQIMTWTRYATIALCIIQGFMWLGYIRSQGLVYAQWAANPLWWLMAITALTAGTVFLMWIGEQIDRFGIGNGVSMIIMAGILTGMPRAIQWVVTNFDPADTSGTKLNLAGVVGIVGAFVLVVAGSVLLTVAQRRIPVTQAKHTRGRQVFGGQRSYLPLRVNHSGVMPVIFASSLMIFPSVIFSGLAGSAPPDTWWYSVVGWLSRNFTFGQFPYLVFEVVLIYFFAYFWITVQFNPEDMSKQLRDHGSFIPGLRPGPRTAEYLETVMERITFVGAGFLALLAVLPMVIHSTLNIDMAVTTFLGGTGLLIVVSVVLDFVQRVEANLLMRNYAGFLGGNDGEGPRMRGPRA